MKISKLSCFVWLVGMTSCASLSSHQTGRTLGDGNSSVGGNLTAGYLDSDHYNQLKIKGIDSGAFVVGEINRTIGVSENLDLGAKFNSALLLTLTSKYQFIGDKNSTFASSAGLNLGTSFEGIYQGFFGFNASILLYNSVHVLDNLAFTFTPRYTYLSTSYFSKEDKSKNIKSNIFGYSVGAIIGKKHQFSIELSQFVNNSAFSFNTRPIVSLGFIINQ